MTSQSIIRVSMLFATLTATPSLTSFVLLGSHKSKLPASEENPIIEFQYHAGSDVPALRKKEEIADGIYADKTDQEMMQILLQIAMDQWNQVRGSYLRMTIVDSAVALERNHEDRLNVIVVEKNTNASTAAFATPTTNPDDALELYDCDISVSTTPVSALSMLKTLTHELGHCVGLGHPHNNYGAIMSYSRTDRNFHLGPDDKAGAIFLYPDPAYDADKQKELIGCGNIGIARARSPLSVLFLLGFPLISLVYRKYCRNTRRSSRQNR